MAENKGLEQHVLGASDGPRCPQVTFEPYVEPSGLLCWRIKGESLPSGSGPFGCDWGYQVLVNGQPAGGVSMLGGYNNCLAKPGGTMIDCHSGGGSGAMVSGNSLNVTLKFTSPPKVAGLKKDCRPELARHARCQKDAKGNWVCLNDKGRPIPTPIPPLCRAKANTGQPISYQTIAAQGQSRLDISPKSFGYDQANFAQKLRNLVSDAWQRYQKLLEDLLAKGVKDLPPWVPPAHICEDVDFVFTPYTSVSYTFPDEQIQREGIFQRLAPPTASDKFRFRHGSNPGQFVLETHDEGQIKDQGQAGTSLDIFGQGGVHNAYQFTLEELTPPQL